MKRRNRWYCCCTLFCFLFIAACASSPTVTGVWMDEEYVGEGINKVLVLGVTNKVPTRRMFEDQFVSQLKDKGIDAIASYRLIQMEGELSRENIQSKIEGYNVDTILITKVVAKKQEEIVHPGSTYVVSRDYRYGYHDYYRRGYRYINSPTYIEQTPPTITEYEVLSLETNLYEIKNEKLIISILSDVIAVGTADSLIKSYIDMAMKELSERNLI